MDATIKRYAQDLRTIRSSDLPGMSAWMAKWYYEEQYQSYQSPQDFIRWLEWFRPEDCAMHYLLENRVATLAAKSERESRRILAPLFTNDYKFKHVDEYNAVDFLLQSL